jgi:hypothetical protein
MKTKIFTLFLLATTFLFGCSKDDNKTINSETSSENTSNAIVGVWMVYTPDFPVSTSLVFKWRVFFENRKSLSILPNAGLFNYDINQEQNWSVGNYTFSGNNGKGRISPESQYDEIYTIIEPNKLKIDNITYYKCLPITGKKINAAYTTYANPSDPDLQILPIGQKPVITFLNDGRFFDEGVFNTYLFDGAINPIAGAFGFGTYEIKDFSIIFKYTDGTSRIRQESLNCFLSTELESANSIFLHRTQLNKMP